MLATTLEVGDEKTAALHVASYETFHRWVEGGALESVRCELSATLFPVFAQCFLVVVATEAEASGEDGGEPVARAFLERWGASPHADASRRGRGAAARDEPRRRGEGRLLRAAPRRPLGRAAERRRAALLGDFLTPTGNAGAQGLQREEAAADALKPTVLDARVAGADAARLSCCAASRDARGLAGGFADASLRLWRVDELAGDDAAPRTRRPRRPRFAAHDRPVYALAWSSRAATCSPAAATGAACSGTPTRPGRGRRGRAGRAALLLRGARRAVLVRGLVRGVRGPRLRHGRRRPHGAPLRHGPRGPAPVFAGHWADAERRLLPRERAHYVLSASHDKTCRLWDARAPAGRAALRARARRGRGRSRPATRARRRAAAAAGLDGGLHLWDLDSGRKLSSTKAHRGPAYVAKFSADGAAVATSGRDRSLKVWDAAALAAAAGDDVAPAHAVETTDSPVFDVAWTPGNLCLASGPLLA
ncbi:TATA-box binding protein [Aureococcus anophagefferens]|uniref:TATA-box binding protein n=1 Tax=Aureococcus anophagefferens TaxID=44056 RepID=A0ABR1FTG7_AURAN